jgi:prepilin-type N-terminal cleavage/methylation domain-containing protein
MTRRRSPDSGGFTLVEVMIAIVVSTAIVVPLSAWIVLAFRQHGEIIERSHIDDGTSFASVSFTRDANSANSVALGGADCDVGLSGLPAASAPGTTVLISFSYDDNGNGESRTVYLVTSTPDGAVLERHRCDATGALDRSTTIADHLSAPSAGWSAMVDCSPRPGYPSSDRGRCNLVLTNVRGRRTSVSASLRTGGPR